MKGLPIDFDSWRDAALAAPEALAAQWISAVASIPESVKRATLLELICEADLAEAFRAVDSHATLGGVPFLVKDLYDLANKPTLAGSVFLDQVFENPTENAEMVDLLSGLGAICTGKTQLVEFAYGMTGENPHYGDCPHPSIRGSLTGGSSSGSAWAVASALVPFALGTDTAGSIRVPSAFCGVFGLRLAPEVWDEGVFPLAPSYDTVGWLTRFPQDMHALCSALLPATGKSSRARALYIGDWVPFKDAQLKEACAQWARILQAEEDPELGQWMKHSWEHIAKSYFILSSYEAAGEHQAWLDTMRSQYDPVVWSRLHQGRQWLKDERAQAAQVRARVKARFKEYFQSYDALVLPITPLPSPQKSAMDDAFRQDLLKLNVAVSLAGLPALSIPVPLPDGRSGGLQIVFPSVNDLDVEPWLDRLG